VDAGAGSGPLEDGPITRPPWWGRTRAAICGAQDPGGEEVPGGAAGDLVGSGWASRPSPSESFGLNQSVASRDLRLAPAGAREGRSYYDFIQTDASINRGLGRPPGERGRERDRRLPRVLATDRGSDSPSHRPALRVARELQKRAGCDAWWGSTPSRWTKEAAAALARSWVRWSDGGDNSPASAAGLRRGDAV